MQLRSLGRSSLRVAPLCLGGNVFGWTATKPPHLPYWMRCWVPGSTSSIPRMYIPFGRRDTGAENPKRCLGFGCGGAQIARMSSSRPRSACPWHPIARACPQSTSCTRSKNRCDDCRPTTLICTFRIATIPPYPWRTLSTYQKLISQGKVRAIGASNFTAARMGEALELSRKHALPRYEVLQPHYNLYARADYESALESLCLEHQIGVVSYFALAAGFLTGKYRTPADAAKSARGQGIIENFLNERGLSILAALDEVGRRHGAKPASVALAWQIARPSITAPIASATTVDQLNDLVAATQLKLDRADIERLNSASA